MHVCGLVLSAVFMRSFGFVISYLSAFCFAVKGVGISASSCSPFPGLILLDKFLRNKNYISYAKVISSYAIYILSVAHLSAFNIDCIPIDSLPECRIF